MIKIKKGSMNILRVAIIIAIIIYIFGIIPTYSAFINNLFMNPLVKIAFLTIIVCAAYMDPAIGIILAIAFIVSYLITPERIISEYRRTTGIVQKGADDILRETGTGVREIIKGAGQGTRGLIGGLETGARGVIRGTGEGIRGIIGGVQGGAQLLTQGVGDSAKALTTAAEQGLTSATRGVEQAARGIAKGVGQGLRGLTGQEKFGLGVNIGPIGGHYDLPNFEKFKLGGSFGPYHGSVNVPIENFSFGSIGHSINSLGHSIQHKANQAAHNVGHSISTIKPSTVTGGAISGGRNVAQGAQTAANMSKKLEKFKLGGGKLGINLGRVHIGESGPSISYYTNQSDSIGNKFMNQMKNDAEKCGNTIPASSGCDPIMGYNAPYNCSVKPNDEDACMCSGVKMWDNELGAQGLTKPQGYAGKQVGSSF